MNLDNITTDENLRKALWILNHSKTARPILNKVIDAGYEIICEDLSSKGIGAGCHPSKKIILLQQDNSPELLAFKLSHEMAHAEQIINGAKFSYIANDTNSSIITSRCMEADAVSKHCIIASELNKQGYKTIYEEAQYISPESLQAVETAIDKKQNPYVAGFKAWFSSEFLVGFYEKQHIKFLSSLSPELNNQKDAFTSHVSSADLVKTICTDSNNQCYLQDSLDIMDKPLYRGVSSRHALLLGAFFDLREQKYGLKNDQHIENIPVFEASSRKHTTSNNQEATIKVAKTKQNRR